MANYTDTSTSYTATTAATSVADIEAQLDDEDDRNDVVTGVSRPQRKIVLTKRTYLLVAFVIILGLSIAAYVMAYQEMDRHDFPPTIFSSESCFNTMYALVSLIVVTPIGFIILKFRVANLLIGFLYMFSLVVCIFFASKGIARGFKSLHQDTALRIHQYVSSENNEKYLHPFWNYYQAEHKCCGTKDIDRVEDWTALLNTTRLPYSCCTDEYRKELHLRYAAGSTRRGRQSLDLNCGVGLGRTRTRRLKPEHKFRRVPSGFYLSLTEHQTTSMENAFNIIKDLSKYEVFDYQVTSPREKESKKTKLHLAFQRYWDNFFRDSFDESLNRIIEAMYKKSLDKEDQRFKDKKKEREDLLEYGQDMIHPKPNSVEKLLDKVKYSIGNITSNIKKLEERCVNGTGYLRDKERTKGLSGVEYCKQQFPTRRRNAVTIGRELLLRMDYLTSYIYEFNQTLVKRWVLWPLIPTASVSEPNPSNPKMIKPYPYNLAANLFRVIPPIDNEENARAHGKQMYYLSRGITENYALRGVIHDKVCETMKEEYTKNLRSKVAIDMAERWVKNKDWLSWINPEEGLGEWFADFVHEFVTYSIMISSGCIVCVTIIAVIFWQYYSRIKAEEYANLALPKEFEVLHLRRGSMIDQDDIAISRPKKKAKVAPASGLPQRGMRGAPVRGQGVGRGVRGMPPPPPGQSVTQAYPGGVRRVAGVRPRGYPR